LQILQDKLRIQLRADSPALPKTIGSLSILLMIIVRNGMVKT